MGEQEFDGIFNDSIFPRICDNFVLPLCLLYWMTRTCIVSKLTYLTYNLSLLIDIGRSCCECIWLLYEVFRHEDDMGLNFLSGDFFRMWNFFIDLHSFRKKGLSFTKSLKNVQFSAFFVSIWIFRSHSSIEINWSNFFAASLSILPFSFILFHQIIERVYF